ncbi:hypothetical protein V1512DRAFT_265445 [Lipomyces arxii]|uniref:uncharacterized protein n=1 Tax=Lipomyces arxii TaxID=56418 RepID=UPI0034CEAED1
MSITILLTSIPVLPVGKDTNDDLILKGSLSIPPDLLLKFTSLTLTFTSSAVLIPYPAQQTLFSKSTSLQLHPEIRFSLMLPLELPPSLTTPHTTVTHTLTATLTPSSFFRSSVSQSTVVPLKRAVHTRHTYAKQELQHCTWRIALSRAVALASHVDVRAKLAVSATDLESVAFEIVQVKTKSFASIGGMFDNTPVKSIERIPYSIDFSPPPPPADLSSPSVATYSFCICLSLRHASKLLPTCDTPFLKVTHRIKLTLVFKSTRHAVAFPLILTDRVPEQSSDLPSYDDAILEHQIVYTVGPLAILGPLVPAILHDPMYEPVCDQYRHPSAV